MYKDTYLGNDADLKPFLYSSGECIPGAACQALSVLPWTCWAKSGALHKAGTSENAAGMKHLQPPGGKELAQSCLGAELSPPAGSRMEQQTHNCWKRKGRRRMDWTGSPFSCNRVQDWLPSLGKHHSDVEVAFGAVMRAGCVWCWRFGVAPCWAQTIELLRKSFLRGFLRRRKWMRSDKIQS